MLKRDSLFLCNSLTEEDLAYLAEIQDIEGLIPSGETLSAMADHFPPPQSWFDEGEDHPREVDLGRSSSPRFP